MTAHVVTQQGAGFRPGPYPAPPPEMLVGHGPPGPIRRPFFFTLSELERDALLGVGRLRSYRRGEVLFRVDDGADELLIVEGGRVKLTRFGDSHERVLHIAGVGDVVSPHFLSPDARQGCEARALSGLVTLRAVPREAFLDLARRVPGLLLRLAEALTWQLARLEERLEYSGAPVVIRLCRTLLQLTGRFGHAPTDGWSVLDIRLSHEELASLCATSRVSFTKNLQLLRDLGLVQGTRGSYRVRIGALESFLEMLVLR